jgi:hypothetical protein
MMGRKKDDSKSESKEDRERDAREKAISGSLKSTESKEDKERDTREKAVSSPKKPKADAEPVTKAPTRTVTKEEGKTASGLPREARGVGPGRPKDVSTAGAISAANQGIPPTPDKESTNIPSARSSTSPAGASGRDPSRYGKPVKFDELFKKGGSVKSSASKRGDGIALRGKTRGRMV